MDAIEEKLKTQFDCVEITREIDQFMPWNSRDCTEIRNKLRKAAEIGTYNLKIVWQSVVPVIALFRDDIRAEFLNYKNGLKLEAEQRKKESGDKAKAARLIMNGSR